MKAAILEEFHQPLVVEEVELLPPAPDGAIVRTTASAFCITDCMNQRGELGKKLPTILGHAGVGVVEEVGPEVTRARPGGRGRRARDARMRRLLLVRSAAGPTSAPTLVVPQPHVANRANGEEVTSLGRRRHVRGEDARAARPGSSRSRPDLPDDQLSLLGCGITTGLGAVFNAAEVEPGSSVAVVGLRPSRASGWCRARASRAPAGSSPSSPSRTGGGSPVSSARPISSTRPPAIPSSRCVS